MSQLIASYFTLALIDIGHVTLKENMNHSDWLGNQHASLP